MSFTGLDKHNSISQYACVWFRRLPCFVVRVQSYPWELSDWYCWTGMIPGVATQFLFIANKSYLGKHRVRVLIWVLNVECRLQSDKRVQKSRQRDLPIVTAFGWFRKSTFWLFKPLAVLRIEFIIRYFRDPRRCGKSRLHALGAGCRALWITLVCIAVQPSTRSDAAVPWNQPDSHMKC